jgi:hypothetical protein
MKIVNPQIAYKDLPIAQQKFVQSVHKAMTGSMDIGVPVSKNLAGVWNGFTQGNGDGVLVRVGANGTTEQQYTWGASNAGISINHALGRQPIGFHVVDSDKDLRVYRTTTPDNSTISLAPTDNTVNATIYIF